MSVVTRLHPDEAVRNIVAGVDEPQNRSVRVRNIHSKAVEPTIFDLPVFHTEPITTLDESLEVVLRGQPQSKEIISGQVGSTGADLTVAKCDDVLTVTINKRDAA